MAAAARGRLGGGDAGPGDDLEDNHHGVKDHGVEERAGHDVFNIIIKVKVSPVRSYVGWSSVALSAQRSQWGNALAVKVVAWVSRASPEPRGIIYTLLRDNVAGAPVVHQKQEWNFDPDVGLRRRDEFQRMHGYRAYNLVAQAGLGEDGRMEERRQQQAYRDSFPVPPEQDWQPGQPQPPLRSPTRTLRSPRFGFFGLF